jgi:Lecithin retinol acyltransferase
MRAGDHICITTGGVAEHAIDVGDRTVIHFVQGEGLKRSRLAELAPDGARVEVVVHRHRVYVPKQVVARAFSRFSDSAYSAMFRDSEEFASWYKTGKMPAHPLAAAREPSADRVEVAAKPSRAGRARPSTASARRAAAARKPKTAKKAGKGAPAARAKAARTARSAPAKRAAAAKPARGGAKARKASVSGKAVRTTRSGAKPARPTRGRKGLPSPAAKTAKAQKRTSKAPASSAKQKRSKAQGRRAATAR